MKRIKNLLKTAGVKFEFKNMEIRFHKRQVLFLVVVGVNAALSYVYRSAKFDAKFFNFFSRLFICFTFDPNSFVRR